MTVKGRRLSRGAAGVLALAITGGLLGCESVTFQSTRWEATQEELNRRYGLWQAAAPAHYEYKFNRFCPACTEDLLKEAIVEVMDTTILAVTYTDGSGSVPASGFSGYFTVEGLFRQIQTAISLLADSLRVEYDPTLHYPSLIVGDPNALLENDELGLFATELVAKP